MFKDNCVCMCRCMCMCMHAACKRASMQACKHESMQAWKHESMQAWKYASMQLCKCAIMQVCNYASMQAFNYASMQVCNYGSMHVCDPLGLNFQNLTPPLVQGLVQFSFKFSGFFTLQSFLHSEMDKNSLTWAGLNTFQLLKDRQLV